MKIQLEYFFKQLVSTQEVWSFFKSMPEACFKRKAVNDTFFDSGLQVTEIHIDVVGTVKLDVNTGAKVIFFFRFNKKIVLKWK